ncbi:MAG TPA: c-type cytochrome [Acidobacteriaceae bacterium]|jgi:aerobic-type carbon monoxide dehydrogenase small subunit (CoxS/CutS family)
MPRTFVLVAAIVTLSVLSSPSLLAQEGPPPAEAPHATAAAPTAAPHGPLPKPVNLKVLPKDTSPEDVIKIMRRFTQQLGVHCGFCHAENATTKHPDFASDEKPEKNTARTMMLMTQEINAKYLAQIHDPDAAPAQKTVSCGTCHRGQSMPAVFVAKERAGTEQPSAAPKP